MGLFWINSWNYKTIFNPTQGKIDLEIEVSSPDSAEEFPNMLRYLYGGNQPRIFKDIVRDPSTDGTGQKGASYLDQTSCP